jgi:hypothetical protein
LLYTKETGRMLEYTPAPDDEDDVL